MNIEGGWSIVRASHVCAAMVRPQADRRSAFRFDGCDTVSNLVRVLALFAALTAPAVAQPTAPPAASPTAPQAGPQTAQDVCKQVASAVTESEPRKTGEQLLGLYESAARFAHPAKSSLETVYLQGGKSTPLLIDAPIEPSEYYLLAIASEDRDSKTASKTEVLAVRSIPATAAAPKRLEVTINVPVAHELEKTSYWNYWTYGEVDYRLVMCLRNQSNASADKPPIVIAREDAGISSRPRPLLVTIVLSVALYLSCGFAKARCCGEGRVYLNPLKITAGITGQASLSNLQFFIFTLLVFALLVYALLRTGVLVDLSENVLLLLGIVGAGSTASLLTVPARDRLSAVNIKWLRDRGWLPMRPKANDLITDGEDIAIERLQSLAFSVVVFFFMIFQGGTKLASFAIPQWVIGILAASQVIYVAGRAARSGAGGQQPSAGAAPAPDDNRRLDDLVSDARVKWMQLNAETDDTRKATLRTAYETAAKLASTRLLERLNVTVDPALI